MDKLCLEYLEALNAAENGHSKYPRSKLKDISSILDWVQAFSIYVDILSKISPIILQVCWCISTYWFTATLTLSSLTGHYMIISFTKSLCTSWIRLVHYGWHTVKRMPHWRTPSKTFSRSQSSSYSRMPNCLEWNDNWAGCSCIEYHYVHICFRCYNLPSSVNPCHKAKSCPKKARNHRLPSTRLGTPKVLHH